MQRDGGGKMRIELFAHPPKFKKVKGVRIGAVVLSHKLEADTANACDEKIRRAFEDCAFIEREIDHVELSSQVENTHIEFFELPESKEPKLIVKNAKLVALYVERSDGQIYLYFQFEVVMPEHGSIAHFFVDRFGFAIFAEFAASQFALVDAAQADEKPDGSKKKRKPFDGITSMSLELEGEPPVQLDVDKLRKLAKKKKDGAS